MNTLGLRLNLMPRKDSSGVMCRALKPASGEILGTASHY
jgi:hypothetical protein